MKDLEARARGIASTLVKMILKFNYPYEKQKFISDKHTEVLLRFAAEVSAETERRVREETIRRCAKELSGEFPDAGEGASQFIHRVTNNILSLLPPTKETPAEEKK